MEEENKNKEFTSDSAKEVNGLFGFSGENGFKQSEMKKSNFGDKEIELNGEKKIVNTDKSSLDTNDAYEKSKPFGTPQEKAKHTRIMNKMTDDPTTVPENNEKYNIPEAPVKEKTEGEWASRAKEIAGKKASEAGDLVTASRPEREAAYYQISSTTKQDIANERAKEKNINAPWKIENTDLSGHDNIGYSLGDLSEEDRKKYDDAIKVANDPTIDSKDRERAQMRADKIMSNISQNVAPREETLDYKAIKAKEILSDPSKYSDEEVVNANQTMEAINDREFIANEIRNGVTAEQAQINLQDDKTYKAVSKAYVDSLNQLVNDPYAGEWAKNQLDNYNTINEMAEKYPELVSKKTAKELVNKQIADRQIIKNLQDKGQKAEALKKQKEQEESAKRWKKILSQALMITPYIAASLIRIWAYKGIANR